MKKIKFSVDTLGCKVNLSESDFIIKELQKRGMDYVPCSENPDFCIINTCTVTSQSDRKARQIIRRIKSKNKDSKIIVTGCFVVFNKEFLKKNGIDYVVENSDKNKIPDLIGKIAAKKKRPREVSEERIDKNTLDSCKYSSLIGRIHSRPLIKIQDGCEQNCSYCIVPKVRGKYRSVPYGEVLYKVKDLQADGFEEVVLTGIHIGKYGTDFKRNNQDTGVKTGNLADLLERIIRDSDIKRIRVSSIEVGEIDDRLLDILKGNTGRFAWHLHIPLQSGSNRILKLMGRPYSSKYYSDKIKIIGSIFPDIALATDVMVGFPGESEEDFRKTVEIIKKIAFSKIHVFKFSGRKHTPAYWMGNQVDEEVKSQRSKIIRNIGDELRSNYLKHNIGKVLNVVCEEMDTSDHMANGTSDNYIKVYFQIDKRDFLLLRGGMIKVAVDSEYRNGLRGTIEPET
jgi:threonylcarbamoyladenosine tRNA methylthiotransferase MtaB